MRAKKSIEKVWNYKIGKKTNSATNEQNKQTNRRSRAEQLGADILRGEGAGPGCQQDVGFGQPQRQTNPLTLTNAEKFNCNFLCAVPPHFFLFHCSAWKYPSGGIINMDVLAMDAGMGLHHMDTCELFRRTMVERKCWLTTVAKDRRKEVT